jgi:putative transposase
MHYVDKSIRSAGVAIARERGQGWKRIDSEVLDVLVQSRRNKRAALKLLRKLLKKYCFVPDKLVTDDLCSSAVAKSVKSTS